jgi:general secretion pathway protein G
MTMTKNAILKTGIVAAVMAGIIAGLVCLRPQFQAPRGWGVLLQFWKGKKDGGVPTARASLRELHRAVNQFHADTGRWPTAGEGLSVLVHKPADVVHWPAGGYLDVTAVPKDSWGNDFIYEFQPAPGEPFRIKSLGADGRPGGNGAATDLFSTDP